MLLKWEKYDIYTHFSNRDVQPGRNPGSLVNHNNVIKTKKNPVTTSGQLFGRKQKLEPSVPIILYLFILQSDISRNHLYLMGPSFWYSSLMRFSERISRFVLRFLLQEQVSIKLGMRQILGYYTNFLKIFLVNK